MKNTEWIFVFNYDGGVLPTFIKFVTNKTKDEIKKNYGGDNSYGDDTGMGLLSIWYCDEYTEEYRHLGHNLVNHGATYSVYEPNDKRLTNCKTDSIPTVDLDVVFSSDPINDTGDYGDMDW